MVQNLVHLFLLLAALGSCGCSSETSESHENSESIEKGTTTIGHSTPIEKVTPTGHSTPIEKVTPTGHSTPIGNGQGPGVVRPYFQRRSPRPFRFYQHEEKLNRARVNNALIFGIPEKVNESVLAIVEKVGHKLGIDKPLDDILGVYRYTSSKVPQPILMRFKNNESKGKWIIMYRRSKLWNQNIYIQEHLPNKTMQVVIETRKWAKTKQYPHVWTWNNEVYYRKQDNPIRYKVINMAHLQRLKQDEEGWEVLDVVTRV